MSCHAPDTRQTSFRLSKNTCMRTHVSAAVIKLFEVKAITPYIKVLCFTRPINRPADTEMTLYHRSIMLACSEKLETRTGDVQVQYVAAFATTAAVNIDLHTYMIMFLLDTMIIYNLIRIHI